MSKLKTIFFCLRRNKAQETMEIEIAFHPKYYPYGISEKKPFRVCAWTRGRNNCSFLNAGFRVFNFNFNYIQKKIWKIFKQGRIHGQFVVAVVGQGQ